MKYLLEFIAAILTFPVWAIALMLGYSFTISVEKEKRDDSRSAKSP